MHHLALGRRDGPRQGASPRLRGRRHRSAACPQALRTQQRRALLPCRCSLTLTCCWRHTSRMTCSSLPRRTESMARAARLGHPRPGRHLGCHQTAWSNSSSHGRRTPARRGAFGGTHASMRVSQRHSSDISAQWVCFFERPKQVQLCSASQEERRVSGTEGPRTAAPQPLSARTAARGRPPMTTAGCPAGGGCRTAPNTSSSSTASGARRLGSKVQHPPPTLIGAPRPHPCPRWGLRVAPQPSACALCWTCYLTLAALAQLQEQQTTHLLGGQMRLPQSLQSRESPGTAGVRVVKPGLDGRAQSRRRGNGRMSS